MASVAPAPAGKRQASGGREGDQLVIICRWAPAMRSGAPASTCPSRAAPSSAWIVRLRHPPGILRHGGAALLRRIDPSTIDVLLITHFHLDHAASLPYFLEKTTFKARMFMTHATKAIYRLLLSDYVKVSKVSVEDMLYDEQDILRSMDKIEPVARGLAGLDRSQRLANF